MRISLILTGIFVLFMIALATPSYAPVSYVKPEPIVSQDIEIPQEFSFEVSEVVSAEPIEPEPLQGETAIIYGSSFNFTQGILWNDTSWNIWGMHEDGSNKIQITSNDTNVPEHNPIWSPDNSKISYLSYRSIFIMNEDGTNPTRVTDDSTFEFYGDWSPDGNKLVFASDNQSFCSFAAAWGNTFNCEIWTINIDGTNLKRLTYNDSVDYEPRWSPNSEKIIFSSNREGSFALWMINSDGTGLTRITTDGNFHESMAAWSQDGSKIVYWAGKNQTSGLWIMDSDGSNKRLIKNYTNIVPIYPSFSPDGNKITYSRVYFQMFFHMYIHTINIDGTEDINLTGSTGPGFPGFFFFSDWKNGPMGNDTTPPIAPVFQKAVLTGSNFEDVELTWYASADEGQPGGTVKYIIYQSTGYTGVPYGEIGEITATGLSTYTFTHVNAGDGNFNNYFYLVHSVDAAGNNNYLGIAGKFINPLTAGEKFISIPLVQWNTSVKEVLKTLSFDKVRYYDVSDVNDHWKTYMTFKPYKGDLRNIDHKMGFWVNVLYEDNFTVAGLVPEYTEIPLYQGWNVVGYPSFINRTVSEALSGIPWLKVEAYDDNPPYYLKELMLNDTMSPGNGYWIEVSNNTIWNVTNYANGKRLPDLYIVSMNVFEEQFMNASIANVTISNKGTATAEPPIEVNVRVYNINGSYNSGCGWITHNESLDVGESRSAGCGGILAPGNYTFTVKVDYPNTIEELDETNNEMSIEYEKV